MANINVLVAISSQKVNGVVGDGKIHFLLWLDSRNISLSPTILPVILSFYLITCPLPLTTTLSPLLTSQRYVSGPIASMFSYNGIVTI